MRFRIVIACAAAIAAGAVAGGPRVIGQDAPVPRPMLSAERTAAFVDAASRSLDYLPGEVIVKFKPGASRDGQQRALDAVRSRPSVDSLEWAGEVAVLRDPLQADARVLAEQLASQPEVEYAEPNYLLQHQATPNDTGYAPRQWNLQ